MVTPASRKISRMLWRERLRKGGIGLAAVLALGGVFFGLDRYRASRQDPTVGSHSVHATVTGFGNGSIARGGYIVHARLDDGRDVDAFSTLKIAPGKGAGVVLTEARHASGRVTYDLMTVD